MESNSLTRETIVGRSRFQEPTLSFVFLEFAPEPQTDRSGQLSSGKTPQSLPFEKSKVCHDLCFLMTDLWGWAPHDSRGAQTSHTCAYSVISSPETPRCKAQAGGTGVSSTLPHPIKESGASCTHLDKLRRLHQSSSRHLGAVPAVTCSPGLPIKHLLDRYSPYLQNFRLWGFLDLRAQWMGKNLAMTLGLLYVWTSVFHFWIAGILAKLPNMKPSLALGRKNMATKGKGLWGKDVQGIGHGGNV